MAAIGRVVELKIIAAYFLESSCQGLADAKEVPKFPPETPTAYTCSHPCTSHAECVRLSVVKPLGFTADSEEVAQPSYTVRARRATPYYTITMR